MQFSPNLYRIYRNERSSFERNIKAMHACKADYDIPSDVISHFDQSAFRIQVTWGWDKTYITHEILIARYSKLRHRRMIHETRRSKVTHQQKGFIDLNLSKILKIFN